MADRRFTDLELERQLAGDLPADRAFDQQATDGDRARLAELRAEHEAFMRSVDVDNEVRRIQQRVARDAPEPARKRWLRWLVPASALAAAAAVVLVLMRRGDHPPPDDTDIQLKGDEVALVVYVATETGSRRVESGDGVTSGDKLRFEIDAAKPGYVALVGIDGSGALSVYYPETGAQPLAYDPHTRLLPGAIALDATPGDEHFYVLYSARPFAVDAVTPALQQNQALPPGISKAEVVLKKKLAP